MALVLGSGGLVGVGRRLAAGGQGEVFEVVSPSGFVFKRFLGKALVDDPTLEDRLRAMLANRPTGSEEAKSGHVMLSWASDVVLDGDRFVGFLMPLIDMSQTVELHEVANPSDRRTPSAGTLWTQGFTWRYLVATAENLALATEILHDANVVVGDFNERNVLVWSDARVTLLDCDSMQITDAGNGRRFLCRVGRPEFTAPELLGANWNTTVRAPSSDLFALAIHLHQLLLEGGHPFDGVWHGSGDKPKRHLLARDGLWVHVGDTRLSPRPGAVGVDLLPPSITDLFSRAFVDGATNPRARPTAPEWHQALVKLRAELVTCSNDPAHSHAAGLQRCPWCERTQARRAQNPLPKATSTATSQPPPRIAPAAPTPHTAATPSSPTTRVRVVIAAIVAVAALAGIAFSFSGGGSKSPTAATTTSSITSETSTTGDVTAGSSQFGSGACPPDTKPTTPTRTFSAAPMKCIKDGVDYSADVVTSEGSFSIDLLETQAPGTVNNFVALAKYGYFDGLSFHRVVPKFINQGGDPKGDGTGGPGYEIPDELPTAVSDYVPGTVAMANAGPNTNGSQFFTCIDCSTLPSPAYSIFGQVISGMDIVQRINALGTGDGPPSKPVTITSVTIKEHS